MLRHWKITNHEIKILRPRYTQVTTIISDRLPSKNTDVTLHIPFLFNFSIKETQSKLRCKSFHETIFEIEILGFSDSVFSPGSKYAFHKSDYALDPFIWPKMGPGQPTQIWKYVGKQSLMTQMKSLFNSQTLFLSDFSFVRKSLNFVSCRFFQNCDFGLVWTP